MKLTFSEISQIFLLILLVLYVGFWVVAFIKEGRKLEKLPGSGSIMSLKKDTSWRPNCPICGENKNVIKNPFQDNDNPEKKFWCIFCDRKFCV